MKFFEDLSELNKSDDVKVFDKTIKNSPGKKINLTDIKSKIFDTELVFLGLLQSAFYIMNNQNIVFDNIAGKLRESNYYLDKPIISDKDRNDRDEDRQDQGNANNQVDAFFKAAHAFVGGFFCQSI